MASPTSPGSGGDPAVSETEKSPEGSPGESLDHEEAQSKKREADDDEDEEEEDEETANMMLVDVSKMPPSLCLPEEMEGFLVDDKEAVSEDDEEEDKDEEEDEEDALDEDDLDLIAENMGMSVPDRSKVVEQPKSKFKRLRRPGRIDEDADTSLDAREKSPRRRGDLFDEEEGAEAPGDHEWPEEGEEEDHGMAGWGEEVADGGRGGGYAMQPEVAALINEVFGDLGAVMEILGRRRPREAAEVDIDITRDKRKGASKEEGIEETEQLNEEEICRRVDQAERYHLRYKKRPKETPMSEITAEAKWLTTRIMTELGQDVDLSLETLKKRYTERFGPKSNDFDLVTSVEADLEEKISQVLTMILNQRLEVPFILTHRAHLICPPLDSTLTWAIFDLDQEWYRLRSLSLNLSKLLNAIPEPKPSGFEHMLDQVEHFKTEEDLEDVRVFVLHNFPELFDEEDKTANVPISASSPALNRRRRQTAPGLDAQRLIKKFELDLNWKAYLLSPQQLAANLQKSDAYSALLKDPEISKVPVDVVVVYPAPDPPPLPGRDVNAVKSWLSSLAVGPFSTGGRVLETLLAHESKLLASHPQIRALIRKWFHQVAKISTVTTPNGEMSVSPGAANWASLRIFRKSPDFFLSSPLPPQPPLPTGPDAYEKWHQDIESHTRQCRKREVIAEIFKAESAHLAQMIVHPITTTESVPWRGEPETVEAFKNRYPRKAQLLGQMELSAFTDSDKRDDNTIDKLFSALKGIYLVPGETAWGAVVQEKVLLRMLEKELLPIFRRELRQQLARRSHYHIASRCQANLEWRLGMRPYRKSNGRPFYDRDDEDDSDDSDSDEDSDDSDDSESEDEDTEDRIAHTTPRTVGMVIERLSTGCRIHAVSLDRTGMPTQYRKFDRLLEVQTSRRQFLDNNKILIQKRVTSEKRSLKHFLMSQDVSPEIVLIGASDLIARDLFDIVQSVKQKMKKKRRFELVYASLEVPRIFSASELYLKEFRETYGNEGCQAIGLGRLAQDPLACHCQLWSPTAGQNLLLDLKLHPLQDAVPKERLESALFQTIQMVVASVGVNLQAIRGLPHLQSTLQFVCGLGPHKAADLIHKITTGNPILAREELQALGDDLISENSPKSKKLKGVTTGPIGPLVYRNCASFIKIPLDVDADCPDPLAASRIDPIDCYTAAQKMCRDALDDEMKGATPNECVWAVMKRPDCLDELDLEAYALILNAKGQPRRLPLLEFMRKELESPYADSRMPFESVSGSHLFYLLVQEDPYQFAPGCETTACIVESRAGVVKLALPPSNIPATPIDLNAYLREETQKQRRNREYGGQSADMLLPRGGMVSCRLKSIDVQQFVTNVVLTEAAAVDVMLNKFELETPGLIDPDVAKLTFSTLLSLQSSPTQALEQLDDTAANTNVNGTRKRRIRHPRFRQVTQQKALMELKGPKVRVGESLFTPNDQKITELTLYIKICSQPFLVKALCIQEKDQKIPGDLGKELWIGTEKFHDLDQILGQYVESLRVNLQEIYTFEKYRPGASLQSVETSLIQAQEQKTATTGTASIEWGLVIDEKHHPAKPGVRFHLVAIPPRQPQSAPVVLRDGLYVNHEDFKLWNHSEKSLRRLTNWWKSEGYFQRQHLLAEYTFLKKRHYEQKRQQAQQQQNNTQRESQQSFSSHVKNERADGWGNNNNNNDSWQTSNKASWGGVVMIPQIIKTVIVVVGEITIGGDVMIVVVGVIMDKKPLETGRRMMTGGVLQVQKKEVILGIKVAQVGIVIPLPLHGTKF